MSDLNENNVKVLVCQRGARHRYAIPRLLEEAGMLTALYTDSCVHSPVGRLASMLPVLAARVPRMQALASRKPRGIPKDKVFSSDRLLYSSFSQGLISSRLDPVYKRWGLRGANVVYNMNGEDADFLEWAKRQGAKLIIDIFVHPDTARIVEKEMFHYTGKSGVDASWIEAVEGHFRRCFALADVILCPSGWVAEGVREYTPQDVEKICIVPYGSSLDIHDSINETPMVGRIFFAGREALRKGLHYLADAARILRARGMEIDVRVAGISHDELAWMKNHRELNCLGTLPLNLMHNEFERADVFVLPSLSEGQAGALLEAMACGCPVIATRESGVDFEPGCGITVPSRNTEALAQAIMTVIGDRDHRNQLARGALQQAESFSMEKWKERLAEVVQEVAAN